MLKQALIDAAVAAAAAAFRRLCVETNNLNLNTI